MRFHAPSTEPRSRERRSNRREPGQIGGLRIALASKELSYGAAAKAGQPCNIGGRKVLERGTDPGRPGIAARVRVAEIYVVGADDADLLDSIRLFAYVLDLEGFDVAWR